MGPRLLARSSPVVTASCTSNRADRLADAVDPCHQRLAALQVARRGSGVADPAHSSAGDDITKAPGKGGGEVANQVNRPQEQIRDRRTPYHLATGPADHL